MLEHCAPPTLNTPLVEMSRPLKVSVKPRPQLMRHMRRGINQRRGPSLKSRRRASQKPLKLWRLPPTNGHVTAKLLEVTNPPSTAGIVGGQKARQNAQLSLAFITK